MEEPSVRVARVYFSGEPDTQKLAEIYDDPKIEFGGWREDEKGRYLRLIIIGDVEPDILKDEGIGGRVCYEKKWPNTPTNKLEHCFS